MNHTAQRKEQRLRAAIRSRGLSLAPFGNAGAVRVAGRDVYVIAAEMRYLDERDLEPHRPAVGASQQQAL